MRRLALALLVVLTAVAATAAEGTAVRITVYQRIPHLVEGEAPETALPDRLLAPPEGGWPASYDGTRNILTHRQRLSKRDVMIAEILIPQLLGGNEKTDFFIPELGKAIELQQAGANVNVFLPKVTEPVVIPASGTSVLAGKDEQMYLAVTVKPSEEFRDDAMVIMNGMKPLKIVSRVEPKYPLVDAFRNRTGTFFTELKVEKDGSVSDAHVLDHVNPEIEAAAVDAYKQWQFEPPSRDGHPIVAYMIMATLWHID